MQSVSFSVREAGAADAARVDAYVRAHAAGSPFHLSGWGRAIEKACGQKARTLVAEDGSGAIVGVLPLTEIRHFLFGKALAASGFAVGGGLLASSDLAQKQLTDAAVALAGKLGIASIELRGGPLPEGWHVDDSTYLGFARDLAKDDEAELLAVPRKQRAEVRKALGFNLTVDVGTGPADRDAHFAIYAESVRNLGTPVFPKALFAAVLEEFGDEADILTVRHEGRPIASVLSFYWNGVVMPYWGGGTADARTWRANDQMYYALMCHARANKGATRFDFGRSKAGTGPAGFKKNWGFEGEPLSYAKYGEVRDINPLSPKYRMQIAVWQKLPLWLANMAGPILSRGLG
jgi:FemAB-related protein (PEP-CTERM system-associated)